MSAMTGIGDSTTIRRSASTSLSRGTAQRIRSPPAAATARIWRIVASTSAVSVLVIDCTATGAPPPIFTPPTSIWRLEATKPQGIGRVWPKEAAGSLLAGDGGAEHHQEAAAPGRCVRRAAWLPAGSPPLLPGGPGRAAG